MNHSQTKQQTSKKKHKEQRKIDDKTDTSRVYKKHTPIVLFFIINFNFQCKLVVVVVVVN